MLVSSIILLSLASAASRPATPDYSYPLVTITEVREVHTAPEIRWGSGGTTTNSHVVALRLQTTGTSGTTTSPNYIFETFLVTPGTGTNVGGALATPADYTSAQTFVYKHFDGDEWVYAALPSNWATNGSTANVKFALVHHFKVTATGEYAGNEVTYPSEFQFKRFNCLEAAIDGRTSYGQPNTAGIVPGDANAPLRNVNFGNWTYRGGLFVGHMPPEGKDKSGTARTQFYPDGEIDDDDADFYGSCLVARTTKAAPEAANSIGVRAYIPSEEHSSLSSLTITQKEMAVTWNTRWITEFEDEEQPAVAGPYSHQTIDTDNKFYCWPLTKQVSSSWVLGRPHLGVVLTMDEASLSTAKWRYFASREWLTEKEGISQTITDGRSRIISLRRVGAVSWTWIPPVSGS